MKNHEDCQIQINGETIKVDSKIANLLIELNKVGLTTTQHCIGDDDKNAFLYIDFNTLKSVEIKDMGEGKRLILRWAIK